MVGIINRELRSLFFESEDAVTLRQQLMRKSVPVRTGWATNQYEDILFTVKEHPMGLDWDIDSIGFVADRRHKDCEECGRLSVVVAGGDLLPCTKVL